MNTIALRKDKTTVILIALDVEAAQTEYYDLARETVSKVTGIDKKAIYIHATHTHVAPCFGREDDKTNDIDREYDFYTLKKIVDSVVLAINDLKPARMGIAVSKAERVGFNRRYFMKDGTTKTNPGVNNPDIVKSIGLLDERVNVFRFERECGDNIVIGNCGNHRRKRR